MLAPGATISISSIFIFGSSVTWYYWALDYKFDHHIELGQRCQAFGYKIQHSSKPSTLGATSNMARFILLTLAVYFSFCSYSQTLIREFVQKKSVPIHSLKVQKDDSDLDALGRAIGDARVVMLGEQDHGDAAAFQLKARLVRYLHEKKGFDVLAFESDFYGVTRGWEAAAAGVLSLYQLINQNVGPVWTGCNECADLFDYVPSFNAHGTAAWTNVEAAKKINLTSIYNLDGLKVLGAFSDEHALLEWSKKLRQYTVLATKDVIEICKEQGIDRIVINNDQKNMYVLNAIERTLFQKR